MTKQLFYIGNFGETIEDTEGKYIKEAEMFSIGTHRGVEYTDSDITQLSEMFSADEDIPIQIDHSESARDTVGYVREAFSKGGKLMGKLEIIDKAVQERIDMGLMKKLSISFYRKQTNEGLKPHKIREVSLVAFPQVKGAQLFSENGYVSEVEDKGGHEMTKEEKTPEEFSAELLAQATEKVEADLIEKYNALEEKLEKLSGVQDAFNESNVKHKIEKFSEDNKVVPAQTEALTKLLGSFSEEQATMFDEFMSNSKTADFSEKGEVDTHSEKDKDDKRTQEQKDFDSFYEEHSKKHGMSL